MTAKPLLLLCAAATMTFGANHAWSKVRSQASQPFAALDLHLEVDQATLAAEIVLEVESDEGLSHLGIFDAMGRQVLGLQSTHVAALGMSEIKVESSGLYLREVMQAYPEGIYRIRGMTVSGVSLVGPVHLSHVMPGGFQVVQPGTGGSVEHGDATLAWTPSAGAVRYLLEIEQDQLGFGLEVVVLNGETSFTIPASLLEPGTFYEYSLTAQGDNDNEAEIEGGFYVQ